MRQVDGWNEWAWRSTSVWDRPDRWAEIGGLSVVIPAWNAVAFTQLCINSVRQYSHDPVELIVVDNGSTDETPQYLATVPECTVITNTENRGFAAACNQGAAAATRPLVCFLNSDALVTPGWDRLLARPFLTGPDLLVAAPRACAVSGVQAVSPPLPYQGTEDLAVFAQQWSTEHAGQWEAVDRVTGFCWVMQRGAFLDLGGFDEQFGLGNFEDDDLCRRVRQAGGTVLVVHDCYLHHFGSQTFQANHVDYAALMRENQARYAEKWGETVPAHV